MFLPPLKNKLVDIVHRETHKITPIELRINTFGFYNSITTEIYVSTTLYYNLYYLLRIIQPDLDIGCDITHNKFIMSVIL